MKKLTPEEREQRRAGKVNAVPVEAKKDAPIEEPKSDKADAPAEETELDTAKEEEAPKKESKPKKTKDAAEDVDTPAKQTKTVVSLSPGIPKSAE
jgi:hypothetical protein